MSAMRLFTGCSFTLTMALVAAFTMPSASPLFSAISCHIGVQTLLTENLEKGMSWSAINFVVDVLLAHGDISCVGMLCEDCRMIKKEGILASAQNPCGPPVNSFLLKSWHNVNVRKWDTRSVHFRGLLTDTHALALTPCGASSSASAFVIE